MFIQPEQCSKGFPEIPFWYEKIENRVTIDQLTIIFHAPRKGCICAEFVEKVRNVEIIIIKQFWSEKVTESREKIYKLMIIVRGSPGLEKNPVFLLKILDFLTH